MRLSAILTGLTVLGAPAVNAATSAQWRTRSVYTINTDRFARTDSSTTATCASEKALYCGGTWQGIINQLDYVQGMGFTAIYISPVTKNIESTTQYGDAYHGFWQQDLYSVNGHFGTADDLRRLSQALHDRNMYLMVDVVVNHFGWPGPYNTVDFSQFKPFNSASYFHSYCVTTGNENQATNENCYLGDDKVLLVDVKTEDTAVRNIYNDWIDDLVKNYTIDGLRLDTAKHVEKSFFPNFNTAANAFTLGEVFNGDTDYTCDYQNYMDSIFNYPTYFPLRRFLVSTSGTSTDLVNSIDYVKRRCKDVTLLGSFSENLDNKRFPCENQDMSLAKNLLTYTILADGIPFVYNGQEHHYAGCDNPENREAIWFSGYNSNSELYRLIASLNLVRNQAIYKDPTHVTYNNWVIYSDTQTVAMRKGYDGKQIITIITNRGYSNGSFTLNLSSHGWAAGTQVIEVLSCTAATVDGSGNLAVPMSQGLPRVYYPVAQAAGSGMCGR